MGSFKITIGKHLAFAVVAATIMACTASVDEYTEVYEEGIDKVGKALTKRKLHKITYDVQDDVTDLQNRIGPHKNLSAEDHRKIFDAQNRFFDAVEKRDKELSK